MSTLDRFYWLAVALVSYIGLGSLQSSSPTGWNVTLLVLGPIVLGLVWNHTQLRLAPSTVERGALTAARVTCAAALGWLNARQGAVGEPALELAATISAGAAGVASAFGLARIAGAPGLIQPARAARSVDAAAFIGVLWGAAITISLTRFLAPEGAPKLDPLTLDYASTAASIGSLLVLIAASWRARVLRELELGVGDRAEAAVALSVTALCVAVPVAAIDIAPPDRALPAALIAACLGCSWTVLAPDPARVSSVMRATIAVMMLGVPSTLLAAAFTQHAPSRAGLITLGGCVLALLVGIIARNVARPLGPEQSRWLMAISEANQHALDPDPNAAIAASLRALKKTSRDPTAVPQLWRLDPPAAISVDVAGYLHENTAEIPDGLCTLGLAEPERTLRADTLRALQIRRPEVRPLLAWFDVRGAFSATIVMDDDGPTGFLLLPRGERSTRLTLEEARGARILADRISALLSVTAALARSRQREAGATTRAEHFEREYTRAKRVLEGEGTRHRELARSLARPLLASAYSPAVRLALSDLEQLALQGGALLMIAPVGTDVDAWAAQAHLSSNASGGPLVRIDASAEARESAARWTATETSPLSLAAGGTLFIRDLHLLPLDTQMVVLLALTERCPSAVVPVSPGATPAPENSASGDVGGDPVSSGGIPTNTAAPRLIASLPFSLSMVVANEQVQDAFESLFAGRVLTLPVLVDRAEDLRSLVLDALSRTCRGEQAAGIERRALQALMDYPWPGNERELSDVVERASLLSDGPLLSLDTLRKAGFVAATDLTFASPPTEDPAASRAGRHSSAPRRRPRAPRRQHRGS